MSNPWKKIATPSDVQNLSDIMSEQYATDLQGKEAMKFAEKISDQHGFTNASDTCLEILQGIEETNLTEYCDSDAVIAKVLQCQFDKEYDAELKRVEAKRNGDAKVCVSFENYRSVPDHLIYDSESDDDDLELNRKKDWDKFETNEKEYASLPKRGYIIKDGKMVTKHDNDINGRRNACKVMSFPPEVCTGDGAGFDMKLPNSVFNHLRKHTKELARKNKMLDRKDMHATAELGLDEATRLILFKLINNGLLESINGMISTGKESIVLHANGDSTYTDIEIPNECAIKVFKTTLNEFKTRDKYIEADYRFKNRFSKQNPRKIVHMWAEKEMHNMIRLEKIGINCPKMVCLKKHVLLMSFIGKDNKSAPKLKDVQLKPEIWQSVYNEVVSAMHKMYVEGHIIHADLSEYNILWFDNKCWFIDVSQSVQPDHPHGLKFLLRDCCNIVNFFQKRDVENMETVEGLFKHITGFDEVDINLLDGVHTVFNSLSSRFEVSLDDDRNNHYPFDHCWQQSSTSKHLRIEEDENNDEMFEAMFSKSKRSSLVDPAANFGNEIKDRSYKVDHSQDILDDKVNFGNELGTIIMKPEEISSSSKDKKS